MQHRYPGSPTRQSDLESTRFQAYNGTNVSPEYTQIEVEGYGLVWAKAKPVEDKFQIEITGLSHTLEVLGHGNCPILWSDLSAEAKQALKK